MSRIQDYNRAIHIDDLEYNDDVVIIDKQADVVDTNKVLFDYIFGVDDVTGMPVGDLSVYMGEKANPEIKAFIQANLLQPLSTQKGSLGLPTDIVNKFKGKITDDDIAAFSRNHNEDNEQYAMRMRSYFDNVRKQNEFEREKRQLKKILDASD